MGDSMLDGVCTQNLQKTALGKCMALPHLMTADRLMRAEICRYTLLPGASCRPVHSSAAPLHHAQAAAAEGSCLQQLQPIPSTADLAAPPDLQGPLDLLAWSAHKPCTNHQLAILQCLANSGALHQQIASHPARASMKAGSQNLCSEEPEIRCTEALQRLPSATPAYPDGSRHSHSFSAPKAACLTAILGRKPTLRDAPQRMLCRPDKLPAPRRGLWGLFLAKAAALGHYCARSSHWLEHWKGFIQAAHRPAGMATEDGGRPIYGPGGSFIPHCDWAGSPMEPTSIAPGNGAMYHASAMPVSSQWAGG